MTSKDRGTGMAASEVMSLLREVKGDTEAPATVDQLYSLVTLLRDGLSLNEILREKELAGFSRDQVAELIVAFGSHIARVRKGKRDAYVPTGAVWGMLPLPGFAPTEKDLAIQKKVYEGKRKAHKGHVLIPEVDLTEQHRPLPYGFSREAIGRDIAGSVVSIMRDDWGREDVVRFHARHYDAPTRVLDGPHVALVHWYASHGMAEKLLAYAGMKATGTAEDRVIVEDGKVNAGLCELLVAAFDLLDVARADAVGSLLVLLEADTSSWGTLRAAVAKARWIAPADFDRLDATLEQAERQPGSERLHAIARDRLLAFGRWVQANPSVFAITGVEKLTDAHAMQILASSGLESDEADVKAVTAELRSRLTAMGLLNDLDREIPEGIRAFRQGRLEEFLASREARRDGDPDWRSLYDTPVTDARALALV